MKRPANFFLLIFLLTLFGCIEEYLPETESQEVHALVVDARITNELQRHRITLTRTSPVGKDTLLYENGAQIQLVTESTSYSYIGIGNGSYVSADSFSAKPGNSYQLEITLANGKKYISDLVTVPELAQITSVYALRENNESGEDGVSIYVDGQGLSGASGLYRYEFEETYKVIAPDWVARQFLLTDYDPCALPVPTYNLEVVPEMYERKTCYGTDDSKRIIQYSTQGLNSDIVKRFPVLFIPRNDYIISHRYSVLVKQFVDTPDAFSYYKKLGELSEGNGGLSQVQPGFLNGNIKAVEDPNEKVVGYFSASTVSAMRTFFNYEDVFPGEEKPPYVNPCIRFQPRESHPSYCAPVLGDPCPESVIEAIAQDKIAYYDYTDNIGECQGPYIIVSKVCGDCTVLGSNVKPEFWTDD